jgi:hypothetical protein
MWCIHERRASRRPPDCLALDFHTVLEPILADSELEALRVLGKRLEGMDGSAGADQHCHVHGEQADVRADVEYVLAGSDVRADEVELVQLEAPTQDVQANRMVRQVDDQPHAPGQLLDHEVAFVGLREVPVVLLVFLGRDDLVAELTRRPEPAHLGRNDVFALGLTIEQEAVRPNDVLSGNAAGHVFIPGPAALARERHPVENDDCIRPTRRRHATDVSLPRAPRRVRTPCGRRELASVARPAPERREP